MYGRCIVGVDVSTARLRRNARLVVLDGQGRILLFRYERSQGSGEHAWCTPGGGVNAGESFEDAARRELWEETGLRDVELGPCVWTRDVEFAMLSEPVRSDERYYLVRALAHEVDTANMEEFERGFHRGHRWWSAAELAATDELVFPEPLAELLAPLAAGEVPTTPIAIPP
jgi:ADP-ribose pyrophosphatase YjhB (NUDIX family)